MNNDPASTAEVRHIFPTELTGPDLQPTDTRENFYPGELPSILIMSFSAAHLREVTQSTFSDMSLVVLP